MKTTHLPRLRTSFVAFQKAHNLTADGIAGPQTLAALAKTQIPTNLFDDSCDTAIHEGAQGGCVALIQKKRGGGVGANTKKALGNKTPTPPKVDPQGKIVVQLAREALTGKPVAASKLKDGTPVIGWKGGKIPYRWGGGHFQGLGPTTGQPHPDFPRRSATSGSAAPASPAGVTARAYGVDKLWRPERDHAVQRRHRLGSPRQGRRRQRPARRHHLLRREPGGLSPTASYSGNGMMIHEQNFTNDLVETPVFAHSGKAFYARPKA